MAGTKCYKSPNGKHVWTSSVEKDILGNKTQYRRCDYCRLRQRHVKNIITGRSEGWQTV